MIMAIYAADKKSSKLADVSIHFMRFKLNVFFNAVLFVLLISPAFAADNAKDAADELNALYARTKPCADNKAAYFCSGIIIRGRPNNEKLSWYLSDNRSVGSFSYLRIDITPHVGRPIFSSVGFILTPPDDLDQQKQYQYPVYCEYATDGWTSGGANSRCGVVDVNNKTDHADADNTCRGKGIKTLSEYLQVYAGKTELSQEQRDYFLQLYGEEKFKKMENSISLNGVCSFAPDKDSFDTAMSIHQYVYRDHPDTVGCSWYFNKDDGKLSGCYNNNELVIGAWKPNEVNANQVPIKAFYVIINDSDDDTEGGHADGIQEAFQISDEYSKETRYERRIPVVILDMAKLKSGSAEIFSPAIR